MADVYLSATTGGNPVTAARDPKVSVILPTYNREHFLGEAVQSVLAQTAGDLELLWGLAC